MSSSGLPPELWWAGVVVPLLAFAGTFAALVVSRLRSGGAAADVRRLAADVAHRRRSADADRAEPAKD